MKNYHRIPLAIAICFCGIWLMSQIPFPEQESYATLRIYQKGYMRSGFGLRINEQQVIKKMKPRTWLEVQVPVGTIQLKTIPEFRYPTYEGKSFSLEVEAGKLYYLEALIDYEFFVSRMYLALREEKRAMKEMRRFKKEENGLKKVE